MVREASVGRLVLQHDSTRRTAARGRSPTPPTCQNDVTPSSDGHCPAAGRAQARGTVWEHPAKTFPSVSDERTPQRSPDREAV